MSLRDCDDLSIDQAHRAADRLAQFMAGYDLPLSPSVQVEIEHRIQLADADDRAERYRTIAQTLLDILHNVIRDRDDLRGRLHGERLPRR